MSGGAADGDMVVGFMVVGFMAVGFMAVGAGRRAGAGVSDGSLCVLAPQPKASVATTTTTFRIVTMRPP